MRCLRKRATLGLVLTTLLILTSACDPPWASRPAPTPTSGPGWIVIPIVPSTDTPTPALRATPTAIAKAAATTLPTSTPAAASQSPLVGRIVFAALGQIYVINADGTGLTQLTNAPGQYVQPAWSPDCKRIAFTSKIAGSSPERFQIAVMNADGSGMTRLPNGNSNASDTQPTWSPDGKRIAFVVPSGYIFAMNADGSGRTQLTDSGDDSEPAWSPDGKRIAFVSRGNGDIFLMNADGTGRVRLTNNPAGNRNPAWSPDAKRIAFTSHQDKYSLYVMNADGSGQTRLTDKEGSLPAWSPDGNWMAFYGWSDLWVVSANGSGQPFKLADGAAINGISWCQP